MRQVCTKNSPYHESKTLTDNVYRQWHHPDARETDTDSDYYIEYKCPHCHLVFRQEMPD